MFKKDKSSSEKSKSLLKNKEIRTLRTDIVKQFPSISEEQISSVIPNKAQVFQAKLMNKTILYSVDDVPIVFDVNGRNNFYPSLQLLWHFPNLLKTFIIHGPVSEYIMNGADLMIPGICSLDGLEDLREGDKVSIKIRGNPLPFAVGDSLISFEALRGSGRKKGKAMTVLHLFGDTLSGSIAPNSGFGERVIYPVEIVDQYELSDDDIAPNDEVPTQPHSAVDLLDNESSIEDLGDLSLSTAAEAPADLETAVEIQHDDSGEEHDQEQPVDTAQQVESAICSTEVVDALLQNALLLALKYVIRDQQLPMLASTLWAIILRCHAAGNEELIDTTVDIRRSSHKKVSAFLRHFSTVKLLSLRDQSGVLSLINVQRAHDLFRGVKVADREDFVLRVTTRQEDCEEEAEGSEFAQHNLARKQAQKSTGDNKITVLELFKLTKQLREVFGPVHGAHGEYLTSQEVRDALVSLIKDQAMELPSDKSSVTVPPLTPLHRMIPEQKKKTTEVEGVASSSQAVPRLSEGHQYGDDDEEDEVVSPAARDPWANKAPLRLKIHEQGLTALDPSAPLPSVSPSTASANTEFRRTIAGSSSVGGWGVDKGVAWKAISLPSAPLPAAKKANMVSYSSAAGGTRETNKVKCVAGTSDAATPKNFLENVSADVVVRKDELFKLVLSKASPYYGIVGPDGRLSVHSGQVRKAEVLLETRMGNKTVTILRNLELFGVDLVALTKDCQKKFACSVSHSSVPGVPKDKEVVLQGNFGFEMESYLVSSWGMPRHLIEVKAGKGAKLKKKK